MILGSTTNDVVYEVYIVLDSYGFIAFQPQTIVLDLFVTNKGSNKCSYLTVILVLFVCQMVILSLQNDKSISGVDTVAFLTASTVVMDFTTKLG